MEMGGSSFGEILSTALPSCNTADQSDSQSDHSSNSGEASHTLPWVSFIRVGNLSPAIRGEESIPGTESGIE
jgi:hypothetical protein